ncbi:hypothetical protein [Actinomadura gamaensis]|uniref:Uncharacterized protein n=1 Tax=Actinomadura gamaensis TaxID=1763541 RepID=A0ABV9UBA0_9ACTN
MTAAGQPLALLAAAVAAAPPKAPAPPAPPSAEARNVVIWGYTRPDGTVPHTPPDVLNGTLGAESGDPGGEAAGPPRVCAFLGVGATVRGLAAAIEPIVNSGALDPEDPETPPDATDLKLARAELERALARYLGLDLGPNPLLAGWRAGARIILPIELTVPPAAPGRWTVGRAQLRAWARQPLPWNEAQTHTLLNWAALPLDAPTRAAALPGDPERPTWAEDLENRARDRLAQLTRPNAAPAELARLAGELTAALLANPFDPLFYAVELIRQVRRDRAGDELPLVLAVASGLTDHQARVLGWSMAGNAWFRRCWDALARRGDAAADGAGVATARARLAAALGLAPNGTGAWFGPTERGPSVPPVDLALTPSQHTVGRGPRPERFASVYGRVIPVGANDERTYPKLGRTFRGPAARGRMDPVGFAEARTGFLGPAPTPKQTECWDVARKITPNEGLLDGTRQADHGLLSLGVQQWTIEFDDELTVVLHRLQHVAPDHFDLFFGIRGIGLKTWTEADPASGGEPAPADVDRANPHLRPRARPDTPETWRSIYAAPPVTKWGDAGAGPPDDGVASRVKLYRLDWSTGGTVQAPQPVPGGWAARHAMFGGTLDGSVITFSPLWSGISRLAVTASEDLCVVQLQIAAFRMQRLYDGVAGLYPLVPDPSGKQYPLHRLASSQFMAAALLDSHVNAPGNVRKDLDTAFNRTQIAQKRDLDGTSADDPWLMRMAVNYLGVRRVAPGERGRRDDLLLQLHDGFFEKLDPAPGTFHGWPES